MLQRLYQRRSKYCHERTTIMPSERRMNSSSKLTQVAISACACGMQHLSTCHIRDAAPVHLLKCSAA